MRASRAERRRVRALPRGDKCGPGRRLGLLIALGALSAGSAGAFGQAAPPAGSPAAEGERIYAVHCASCHGAQGEGYIGPPVIGPGAALGPYGDAKGLLDYISATMPQTNPGGLTDEQYRQVLAYLLLRNGLVEPDWSPQNRPLEAIPMQSE